MGKSVSSLERIGWHVTGKWWQGLEEDTMPEDVVEILFFMGSSLADRVAHTSGKKCFLTIARSVCCERRRHSSWHRDR